MLCCNEVYFPLPLLFRSLLRLFALPFLLLPPKFGRLPIQITLSPLRYLCYRTLMPELDYVNDALKLMLQQLIPAICEANRAKYLLQQAIFPAPRFK